MKKFSLRKPLQLLLALSLLLIGILAVIPAPVARATESTNTQWKIEKWSEKSGPHREGRSPTTSK